uniref:Haloacid dehalogenase-like hydrolase n=1 Tax=Pseudictyota dubia TaxID=2749911 RepID=A0A7R9W9K5_9STRA|mmetsp:Transcript_40282/g.74528  ORF Transcript_40282/g.74528 Transcript_40282/m.74528 type:complete len:279 (+) Transcript_40282:491-1327(+)
MVSSPASTVSVIHSLGLKGGKPFGFPLVCLNGARGMEIRPSGMKYPLHDNAAQTTPTGDVSPTEVVGSLRFVELFHEPVPQNVAVKALGLAKELRLVTNYYIGHEIHAQPKEESHFNLTQRYTELTGTQIVHCDDDYGALLKQGLPSKLVVLCDSSELDCVCSKLKEALEGQANVVRGSPPFFVEVLNKDVNKGRGLELMCKRLGVTPEEAIAFGDGDNDKEFLGVAGRGIAMKNARDAVKEVADEVTEWTNAQVSHLASCTEQNSSSAHSIDYSFFL